MKTIKLLLIGVLFFEIAQAAPTKIHPKPPTLRPEGVQQLGNTCHATAFLTALEHHFERINKPVKLSLLYLVYSLRTIIDRSPYGKYVSYDSAYFDDESTDTLEEFGAVIPHYMHPEEHRMTPTVLSHPSLGTKHYLPPRKANIPSSFVSAGWPTIRSRIFAHDSELLWFAAW